LNVKILAQTKLWKASPDTDREHQALESLLNHLILPSRCSQKYWRFEFRICPLWILQQSPKPDKRERARCKI